MQVLALNHSKPDNVYALGFEWKYADEWPTLTTEGF
jgi:hypothetical protein